MRDKIDLNKENTKKYLNKNPLGSLDLKDDTLKKFRKPLAKWAIGKRNEYNT